MKASNKLALYGSLAAAGLLWLICKRKNASINGIGAVKRRIYKEVSLAQDAGIDFSKPFSDMTSEEIETLEELGHNAGWEQKEQKSYAEAYYDSLRKAYNAVSGISGIGRAYNIKDAQGNVVLTWIEDAQAHVDAEKRTLEAEKRAEEARKRLAKTKRNSSQMALFGMGYVAAREPFWYGIKNVQFIYHGEWRDPEIYYRGKYYNASIVEDELYAIWREQIEYGDTELDFEKWMEIYGGDYLKQDVLPYI